MPAPFRNRLLLFRQRQFDRCAIRAPLDDAILIALDIGDGVGDPDAGADQDRHDREGNGIHHRAFPVVDDVVAVLLVFGKIAVRLDRGLVRADRWQRPQRFSLRAAREAQYLPELIAVTSIWPVVYQNWGPPLTGL
jgi:hypothetical protein